MSSVVIFPIDGTGRTITIPPAGIVELLLTDPEKASDAMMVQIFDAGRKVMITAGSPSGAATPVLTPPGAPGPAGTPRLGGAGVWGYWVKGQKFIFASGDGGAAFDIEIFFADIAVIAGSRIRRNRGNTGGVS